MTALLDDLRIEKLRPVMSPALLLEKLSLTPKQINTVRQARLKTQKIVHGDDDRLIVVVGPCSIHDPDAALEYASRLKKVAQKHQRDLHIIMRVYFEKPRTTVGWKGLINDPHLTNTFEINAGLQIARKLLVDITEIGLPVGTEFLDPIIPQYIADIITWGAIGARTTESQLHRELASGLSMPIGFKNGTNGNVDIALDAIQAAQHSHHFLSITKHGATAIVETLGNPDTHIILRGASDHTNYQQEDVTTAIDKLEQKNLRPSLMVDCSHGNSQKDHSRQVHVAQDIAKQIAKGSHHLFGVMIESHLVAGKQSLNSDQPLVYGQSITDACIDWPNTTELLQILASAVEKRRNLA